MNTSLRARSKKRVLWSMTFLFVLLFAKNELRAQYSYQGCSDLTASDFSSTQIFSKSDGGNSVAKDAGLAEPVQFDLDPILNSQDSIVSMDVYFVERKGKLKYYNSTSNSVSEIGTLDVRASNFSGATDYGLMGIVLDPNFKTNNWMYLWYAPRTNNQGQQYSNGDWKRMRLSRFNLNANKTLNMGSEKIMMEMRGNTNDHWHAGGPMTFDSYGDLWVTIGNNSTDHQSGSPYNHISQSDSTTSDEWGTSNTANYRGSIIRIHPDDSQKGYSVPEGNFGEYWGDYFENQGNTTLAAEYRDPAKVLPEIYTKGHRSNYSISVHPTKRWVTWGEVNFQSSRDEFNITNNPLFGGYPYFHGNQERTAGHQATFGYLQDPNAPKNESPLSNGVVDLPPASEPTISGSAKVAISGPIYVFDNSVKNSTKFPPHLNEHWFHFDFSNSKLWISDVNNDGSDVTATREEGGSGNLMSALNIVNPLQAKFGSDGSLYLLNYAGWYNSTGGPAGINRVDYTGNCVVPIVNRNDIHFNINFTHNILKVEESGAHQLSVFDVKGELIYEIEGKGSKQYSFNEIKEINKVNDGIYLISVKTQKGIYQKRISLF